MSSCDYVLCIFRCDYASLKDIESIRHSVRPSRVIYDRRKTPFLSVKNVNDIINNNAMTADEVVASDEPPYFQPKQKKRLVDIPKHYGPEYKKKTAKIAIN